LNSIDAIDFIDAGDKLGLTSVARMAHDPHRHFQVDQCHAGVTAYGYDTSWSNHCNKRQKQRPRSFAFRAGVAAVGKGITYLMGMERKYVPEHDWLANAR
jgi:hypothetical protein